MLPLLIALARPALAFDTDICEARSQRFEAFAQSLAEAPTLEIAQTRALAKTELGHQAIHRGAKLLPGDPGLVQADAQLDLFEQKIRASQTQADVAASFQQLSDQKAAQCDYTTVEIVLIVIGFVLGIIPGIILLLVFC